MMTTFAASDEKETYRPNSIRISIVMEHETMGFCFSDNCFTASSQSPTLDCFRFVASFMCAAAESRNHKTMYAG